MRTVRHYASLRLPFHVFLSSKRLCFFCFFFFFETIYLSILYHMHNLYYNCNLSYYTEFEGHFCSRKEKAKSNVNITNVNIKYTCFLYFILEKRKHGNYEKRNLKLSSILFILLFLLQEIILAYFINIYIAIDLNRKKSLKFLNF